MSTVYRTGQVELRKQVEAESGHRIKYCNKKLDRQCLVNKLTFGRKFRKARGEKDALRAGALSILRVLDDELGGHGRIVFQRIYNGDLAALRSQKKKYAASDHAGGSVDCMTAMGRLVAEDAQIELTDAQLSERLKQLEKSHPDVRGQLRDEAGRKTFVLNFRNVLAGDGDESLVGSEDVDAPATTFGVAGPAPTRRNSETPEGRYRHLEVVLRNCRTIAAAYEKMISSLTAKEPLERLRILASEQKQRIAEVEDELGRLETQFGFVRKVELVGANVQEQAAPDSQAASRTASDAERTGKSGTKAVEAVPRYLNERKGLYGHVPSSESLVAGIDELLSESRTRIDTEMTPEELEAIIVDLQAADLEWNSIVRSLEELADEILLPAQGPSADQKLDALIEELVSAPSLGRASAHAEVKSGRRLPRVAWKSSHENSGARPEPTMPERRDRPERRKRRASTRSEQFQSDGAD